MPMIFDFRFAKCKIAMRFCYSLRFTVLGHGFKIYVLVSVRLSFLNCVDICEFVCWKLLSASDVDILS